VRIKRLRRGTRSAVKRYLLSLFLSLSRGARGDFDERTNLRTEERGAFHRSFEGQKKRKFFKKKRKKKEKEPLLREKRDVRVESSVL